MKIHNLGYDLEDVKDELEDVKDEFCFFSMAQKFYDEIKYP